MNAGYQSVCVSLWIGLATSSARAAAPSASMRATTKHTLPNSITIIIHEDHSSRIAAASVLVRTGSRAETRANAGIRQFVQEMLLRGTPTLSRERVLDYVEARGASLDVTVGDEYVELYASGAGHDIGSLLKLMGRLLAEPAFNPDEAEVVRQQLVTRALRRGDDFPASVQEVLRASLFQTPDGEPTGFGLPTGGLPESLKGIKQEDLVAFFKAHCMGPNIVVAISGDVSGPLVLREAREAFAAITARHPATSTARPPVSPSEARFSIVQSPAPQAWVALGFLVPGLAHADFPAVTVLSTLLGGGMKSRLFVEFREKSSLAYEVGTQVTWRAQQADVVAFAQVDALAIDDAKNRILNQLERLKTELPTSAELERARRKTIGQFILDHQRNRQRAWYLAFFEAVGVGYAFDAEYPERIRRVTAEDIRRVARTHFTRRALVVAMPDPDDDAIGGNPQGLQGRRRDGRAEGRQSSLLPFSPSFSLFPSSHLRASSP